MFTIIIIEQIFVRFAFDKISGRIEGGLNATLTGSLHSYKKAGDLGEIRCSNKFVNIQVHCENYYICVGL